MASSCRGLKQAVFQYSRSTSCRTAASVELFCWSASVAILLYSLGTTGTRRHLRYVKALILPEVFGNACWLLQTPILRISLFGGLAHKTGFTMRHHGRYRACTSHQTSL